MALGSKLPRRPPSPFFWVRSSLAGFKCSISGWVSLEMCPSTGEPTSAPPRAQSGFGLFRNCLDWPVSTCVTWQLFEVERLHSECGQNHYIDWTLGCLRVKAASCSSVHPDAIHIWSSKPPAWLHLSLLLTVVRILQAPASTSL